MAATDTVTVRHAGLVPYETAYQAMRAFTDTRTSQTPDEIWLVEHPPVYTLGQAADRVHLLDTGAIDVVQTDRGGEVTYHGPGQAVAYLLLDLKRRMAGKMRIRELVGELEEAVIETLAFYGIAGKRHRGAPGVYLLQEAPSPWQGAKIAALGLKVRSNGCTYHGLSLNVDMDLQPFSGIHPCGYANLVSVDMKRAGAHAAVAEVQACLAAALCRHLGVGAVYAREDFSFLGINGKQAG
ncbi:MAG: lipoyl(octanoyl) transferase LipB [Alistipes senegalensis]|nr:lipoyl(octanoyl) transferase LipB [Oxalobacter formigenes]MCM1280397.1 lipoyl(octanoyl) transferase LipB [Alistipes senegalensis]